jgi:hypothetical protein
MNTIHQLAEIGPDRQSLRLANPLPESVSTGHVDVTITFRPPDSTFERALEIYKRGNASIAGAAYAAGVDRFDFENFLADIHYPIPQQTVEEVLADSEKIEQMLTDEGRWPPRARSL